MSEQPQGRTGERCKSAGTYVTRQGARAYVEVGECFGPCPVSGTETQWEKVT